MLAIKTGRLAPGDALPDLTGLATVSDAVLLDARSPSGLGGSGIRLPWTALGPLLQVVRARQAPARLILAGGLTPEKERQPAVSAATAVRPDMVDVSSGVESEPGIKDAARMRAFAEAVARVNTGIS